MIIKMLSLVALIGMLLVFNSCDKSFSESNKLKLFHEYDELLNIKLIKDYKGLEKKEKESGIIFEIENISAGYREKVIEYLEYISKVIDDNIGTLQYLYAETPKLAGNAFCDPMILLERTECNRIIYNNFQELRANLEKDLLYHFDDCVRVMGSIYDERLFLLGKEIEDGVFASTVDWPEYHVVLWEGYYIDAMYAPKATFGPVINGVIKYSYWFYETNLKIRIVKQIRDRLENYYGELAVDFYKFDDYDELFDKNGNPRM